MSDQVNRRLMGGGFPNLPNIEPFRIGEFTLRRHAPGKVWIENAVREGMATDETKLAEILARFWRKEF